VLLFDGFSNDGTTVLVEGEVPDLSASQFQFNDMASSLRVQPGECQGAE
jgi:hypothetical protein